MAFPKRTLIVAILALFGIAALWAGRQSAPGLVAWTVRESLVEKAVGSDPETVRGRFELYLARLPEGKGRLEKLLALSQRLEKVQRLSAAELDQILASGGP